MTLFFRKSNILAFQCQAVIFLLALQSVCHNLSASTNCEVLPFTSVLVKDNTVTIFTFVSPQCYNLAKRTKVPKSFFAAEAYILPMSNLPFKYILCLFFVWSFDGLLFCQNEPTVDSTSEKRNSLFAVPVAFFTPETDWAFGVTGIYTFRLKGEKIATRPSQLTLGFAYTLNQQILIYLPYQLFAKNQVYNIYGELGYYFYSYQFYGLGNDTKEEDLEIYKVNYPRLRINALKLLRPNFYGGIRYWMDDFDIREIEPDGILDSQPIVGKAGSFLSGAGLVFNFDNRNNIFFPTKGHFVELVGFANGKYLGSNFNFNKFTLDASTYLGFNRQVLAFNLYGEFTGGTAPFNQLALLGGNRKMRGYFEGRLRDNHQIVLQTEYRFPIYKKRFRGVIFSGIGQVANQFSDFQLNQLKLTYGAGLRILINKKERIHIRLDAGFGEQTSGYYLTIGEAF